MEVLRCRVCGACTPAEDSHRAKGTRTGRKGHLRRELGLTVEAYHSLLDEQGLLCFRCNGGLGPVREDPELLREVAGYLERHASDPDAGGHR